VGLYPITGNFSSLAGYAITALPATLSLERATLYYVGAPVVRLQGMPNPPLPGTVSGFVLGDTQQSSTSGTLNFSSPASPLSAPGRYAVTGSGLVAANYRLVQFPDNETALTVVPSTSRTTPSIWKDVTFESSNVYGKNLGAPPVCIGTAMLAFGPAAADVDDWLSLEWSRLRQNPNLNNCIGVGQRNGCQDF
jgi:hypothetical protein